MKELRHLFSLVPDCHVSRGYYRTLWRHHIYDGLRPLAQRLTTPESLNFDWARTGHGGPMRDVSAPRAESSARLWETIRTEHAARGIDAVISYCYSHDVEPGLVKDVTRLGIPWINFYCDSTHMFEKVEALARLVSLNWFPESAAIDRYRALGRPFLCTPYAMNPEFLPDCTATAPEIPVAFIGLPTSNRITQLGWLRWFGARATIRGHGWAGQRGAEQSPFYNPEPASRRAWKALFQRGLGEKVLRRVFWQVVRGQAEGPLTDDEMPAFLRRCRVVLGLNQGRDADGRFASYLKFRDVEFPGYGCCYLTEHNDDVPRAFEVGREVLTFRNLREAAEHIRRMEREPAVALEIGRAARRRVLETHTWSARLRQFADLV